VQCNFCNGRRSTHFTFVGFRQAADQEFDRRFDRPSALDRPRKTLVRDPGRHRHAMSPSFIARVDNSISFSRLADFETESPLSLRRRPDIRDLTKYETTMSSHRKVAVITGASRGMGAVLVEAYRDRDYAVVATARSIRLTNDDQVLAVPGDIADRKTAERAISAGLARFGRIDTLINNAGLFIAKPFTQYTEAEYAAVLSVNLTGFFHFTQLAIAEMKKGHGGHVVQITTSLIEHANSLCRPCSPRLQRAA
jgi:hypothetical protein